MCGYAGSSFEVMIETDDNDAVEIKTEAESNDIDECPLDVQSTTGVFVFFLLLFYRAQHMVLSVFFVI